MVNSKKGVGNAGWTGKVHTKQSQNTIFASTIWLGFLKMPWVLVSVMRRLRSERVSNVLPATQNPRSFGYLILVRYVAVWREIRYAV